MKIGVIGAGSLGLSFVSQLVLMNDGPQIHLITKTEKQKRAIQSEGIIFESLDGSEHKLKVNVYSSLNDGHAMDYIFLMVKQHHILDIQSTLLKWSGNHTKVICFQNGLGHEELLRSMFKNPIFLAVTTEGALKHGERKVKHTGKGETWIGYPNEKESPSDLINLLNNAGILTYYSEDILIKIWRKLVINIAINPLSALFEVRNGELLNNSYIKKLMNQLVIEVIGILEEEGVYFQEDMFEVIEEVCRKTNNNQSSMLQDILRKRKTEIDAMTQIILERSVKYNKDASTIQLITDLIKAKESLL